LKARRSEFRVAGSLSQWYGHFAGILPVWLRLSAPGALPAAYLAHSIVPLVVAVPAAALYAAGHVALRLAPPRLERLKAADAGLMTGAVAGAVALLAPLVAVWPWLLLPATTLLGLAWAHAWCHSGSVEPPDLSEAPAFVPPARGPVTAGYGGYDRSHTGIDLGLPVGTEVVAPAAGTVRHAGPRGHWGYCVELDHGAGWTTLLAHLERPLTRRGSRVEAGQPVGRSGTSGVSTGPHLHVELRRHGVPVDPAAVVGDQTPA
jgi:murein DD-endopeptidase MepM/ murein hydrolase activator NlpD